MTSAIFQCINFNGVQQDNETEDSDEFLLRFYQKIYDFFSFLLLRNKIMKKY